MAITVISYDPEQEVLRLRFDGGEVYDYFLVKAEEGRAATTRLDDPTYFSTSIRGVYPARRVR